MVKDGEQRSTQVTSEQKTHASKCHACFKYLILILFTDGYEGIGKGKKMHRLLEHKKRFIVLEDFL